MPALTCNSKAGTIDGLISLPKPQRKGQQAQCVCALCKSHAKHVPRRMPCEELSLRGRWYLQVGRCPCRISWRQDSIALRLRGTEHGLMGYLWLPAGQQVARGVPACTHCISSLPQAPRRQALMRVLSIGGRCSLGLRVQLRHSKGQGLIPQRQLLHDISVKSETIQARLQRC